MQVKTMARKLFVIVLLSIVVCLTFLDVSRSAPATSMQHTTKFIGKNMYTTMKHGAKGMSSPNMMNMMSRRKRDTESLETDEMSVENIEPRAGGAGGASSLQKPMQQGSKAMGHGMVAGVKHGGRLIVRRDTENQHDDVGQARAGGSQPGLGDLGSFGNQIPGISGGGGSADSGGLGGLGGIGGGGNQQLIVGAFQAMLMPMPQGGQIANMFASQVPGGLSNIPVSG